MTEAEPRRPGGHAGRLLAPARQVPVRELAATWFMGHVGLTVAGCRFDGPPVQLAGRVRGALGAVLRQGASAEAGSGRPCPWQPPCAFDLLYRVQGRVTPALEIPKPYLLSLRRDGALLHLELTLVGFASDWLEEVASALVLAWRRHLPDARGSEILSRRLWSAEGVAVPAGARGAVLEFLSPLELRFRNGPPPAPADALRSLLTSLGNRVSGLARWQDALPADDWRQLKAATASVQATLLSSAEPESWRRRSSRQQRWIPMRGEMPVLLLEGELEPFLPWLAIGAAVHVGSHAALGLGRYRLHLP